MKLRIRGDSLRLRLTQVEVAALAAENGGRVEESTALGGGTLTYAIACGGTKLAATLVGARIEISVPTELARAWAASDEVGLSATQEAGAGRTLQLLVEKDFACLTKRDEDERDAFPNPNASC